MGRGSFWLGTLRPAPNYPLQQTAALLSVSQGILPSRPPLLSFGVRRKRAIAMHLIPRLVELLFGRQAIDFLLGFLLWAGVVVLTPIAVLSVAALFCAARRKMSGLPTGYYPRSA